MSSTARNTLTVRTTEDIVDAVRAAAADQTNLTAAHHPTETARQLDLTAMNAVVDYPARDMTITVEAGMTVHALTDLLAAEGQQLPVDFADASMTVGAFVASDFAGSRQYGYGTLRDYLIGMEAVDGQGRVFHAGGRVVKNVAGYDLCRLMVGSRGSLAILSQLTLKLKPIPDQFVVHRWSFDDVSAVTASLERLNTSAAGPVVVDLHCPDSSTWSLYVGVDGLPDVCEWQVDQIQQEVTDSSASDIEAADRAAALTYCHRVAGQQLATETVGIVRTLPSQVTRVCSILHEFGLGAMCHAGNGVVIMLAGDPAGVPDAVFERIQAVVSDHGGHIRSAPINPTVQHSAKPCSAGLTAAFDPHRVFV